MFNPNKYDTNNIGNSGADTNSEANNRTEEFIAKREKMLKWLGEARPLMVKECEIMEKYIENNPSSKAAGPFLKKIQGWSKIINGIDVVTQMYNSK